MRGDEEYEFAWLEEASCKGSNPNIFFFDKGDSPMQAKEICQACPVKAECIDYSTTNNM